MLLILMLIFIPTLASAENYQDCIDGVIRIAKIREAIKLGEANCFDKFIQPEFDKRYRSAANKKYVKASISDFSSLRCEEVEPSQPYGYLSCEIPGKTNKIYSIRLKVNLQNGSTRVIELKNSLERDPRDETFKWGDVLSYGFSNLSSKIINLNRSTLEIKWIN